MATQRNRAMRLASIPHAENHAGVRPSLRRRLHSWQIFFIVLGGIIGAGFFVGSSFALSIAGPGGALLAFALVGCVAIAVMEGICEMIVLWPIPNAMVEFVRAFVDEELAKVVGIGYWYTYSVTFSALIVGAVQLADYWNLSNSWKAVLFVAIPIILAAINTRKVEVFGWIELGAGVVKLALVVGLFLLMICLNLGAGPGPPIHSEYFNDGIKNNNDTSPGRFAAICIAIPLATFSYLGVEMVTMTAFEARSPSKDLAMPARNIAWFITLIYIMTTLAFVLNVWWQDPKLPKYYNQSGVAIGGTVKSEAANSTYSAPVIAVMNSNLHAGAVTACFIYSTISAANIGLYAASRALYGLARDIRANRNSPWWLRAAAAPAALESDTGSPWWAITLSILLLCWLPFIGLPNGVSKTELQETLINIGSVSGVLVWSSQCLAYICFYHWRRKHEHKLKGEQYAKFHRREHASHFAFFQPAIAWFGLVSTLLIAFVFNSASMWNGPHHNLGVKFASAYVSPILFIALWLVLKVFKIRQAPNSRWIGVDLSNLKDYKSRFQHLNDLIYPDDDSMGDGDDDDDDDDGPQEGIMMARPPTYASAAQGLAYQDADDEDEPPGDFVPVTANGAVRPPGRATEPAVRRPYSMVDDGSRERAASQPVPEIQVTMDESSAAS